MGIDSRRWVQRLSADQLRSMYLSFFEKRGHAIIPSASLIPEGDASVLFTTAGMHALVPYLLGQPHLAGARLADCQKCVRTNNIESVGDLTHLTFFEMLGNWSLGDHYKAESIRWSFEFLTSEDTLKLPNEILWVACFSGDENAPRDDDSAGIWRSLGIHPQQIVFLGSEHNWWAAGPEGPCGPDTEIFVDKRGGPCDRGAAQCLPGLCDCGRFFGSETMCSCLICAAQMWSRSSRRRTWTPEWAWSALLPCSTMSRVSTTPPRPGRSWRTSPPYRCTASRRSMPKGERLRAMRVVADHLRTSVFIIGDERGVTPSNTGNTAWSAGSQIT